MANPGLGIDLTVDRDTNRLTLIGPAVAAYDDSGNGLRVKKVIVGGDTTRYVFSGSKVIAEYINGAAVSAPVGEYVYAGSRMLATLDSGGTPTYSHQDHLSTRVQTDSNGNVVREFGHQPFGESWYETGVTNKWKFTNYERDSESGLDYATFRFDAASLGRFMSPDPIPGNVLNPQSHNRYGYSLNDPINRVDPLGLTSCTFEGIPVPCSQIPWSIARRAEDPRVVYDSDGNLLGICIVRFHAGGGSTCQFGGESFRESDLDVLCDPEVLENVNAAFNSRNMEDEQGRSGEFSFSTGHLPAKGSPRVVQESTWIVGECSTGGLDIYAPFLESPPYVLEAIIHTHPDFGCGVPLLPVPGRYDFQTAWWDDVSVYAVSSGGIYVADRGRGLRFSGGRRVTGSVRQLNRACAFRGRR